MFGDLLGIVTDVAKVALAPAEIAASATRAVTKPLAQGATEVVKTAKELTRTDGMGDI